MNYYIQGNKEKADQIKAAFGKYVSTQEMAEYDFSQEEYLFYTGQEERGTFVYAAWSDSVIAEIIKTHPDYKELELPAKAKFKVGDWIVNKLSQVFYVSKALDNTYEIIDEDGDDYHVLRYKAEEDFRLWTIEDAKDGDVLSSIRGCPFIYDKYRNQLKGLLYYYAGIDGDGNFVMKCPERMMYHFGQSTNAVPATKKQRDLLFAKMREAGYKWDADKKELRKIKPHYDIANFHAGMPVLVRDDRCKKWSYALYSHYDSEADYPFVTAGDNVFIQCIPFEGNEHLLGTTDPCDEQYINW